MTNHFQSNLWKMYLFQFFTSLHFLGGVLVPFFLDWGQINFTQIMILQAWFMFWVFILEIPTGAVADYLGRKWSLLLGCLANIIAVIVYTSMPNFYIFLVGEFFWAMASALMSGADQALVYDSLKKIKDEKQSKKVLGRMESFSLIALMVSAPIGSIIASFFGLRMTMLLLAVPLLIATFISLTFHEPKTSRKVESTRYLNILRTGITYFHKNKVLKILALDMVIITSIAYFMIWLYQPLLKQSVVNLIYFGLVHAAFVASQILIINLSPKLEQWFGSKKKLLFYGALITGISFVVGGLTTFLPLVILIIILGGGFGLSRRTVMASYLNKQIPSPQRATILSTISMLRQAVQVILNPAVGFMVDWSLNYTLIILGLAAIIFAFISRVEEEHLID